MKMQTRTRLASDDVSDDSALESDVSSLTGGDIGSEDGGGRSPARQPRSAAPRARPQRPRTGPRLTSCRQVIGTSLPREKRSTTTRKDRMLMREWLQTQANRRSIPNMLWYNRERTMIRIPWKHGSRSGWTMEDCQLYRAWAQHTGTYTSVSLVSGLNDTEKHVA